MRREVNKMWIKTSLACLALAAMAGCNSGNSVGVDVSKGSPLEVAQSEGSESALGNNQGTGAKPGESSALGTAPGGAGTSAAPSGGPSGETRGGGGAPNPTPQPGQGGRVGQNPNGGGQPGGGGGMRGFGMGAAGLLRREEIATELKLTADQKQKIEEALAAVRPPQGQQGNQDPEKMRETMEKLESDVNAILNDTQKKRVGEIRLQLEGPAAMARDEIAKQIGLSDAQKKKLRDIQEKFVADMRALAGPREGGAPGAGQNNGGAPRAAPMEGFRKLREKAEADAKAVLTAEQTKKWQAMLGKPFELRRGGTGGMGGGPRRGDGGGA